MPSSVIRKINYDTEQQVLKIVFLSGAVYEYLEVPDHIYAGMMAAISKGAYLNKKILGNYKFRKLRHID